MKYSRYLTDDGFAIFLVHGVIPAAADRHPLRNYTHKHLTVERFTEVLKDLDEHGTPVSMPDIVAASEGRTELPPRAFSITLDDGFRNNLTHAMPVLEAMGIPATFYLTTNFISTNSGSWIDMIEYAAESTGIRNRATMDSIRQMVKNAPQIDPYKFAVDYCRRLGVKQFNPDPELDQKMTWCDVKELSRIPQFNIGGHGDTHRILSYLSVEDLQREIATCLATIRAQVGKPIIHFSYPEGMPNCYNEQVIGALKEHGVICCPTAEEGINHLGDSLFGLKRIMVV